MSKLETVTSAHVLRQVYDGRAIKQELDSLRRRSSSSLQGAPAGGGGRSGGRGAQRGRGRAVAKLASRPQKVTLGGRALSCRTQPKNEC